MDKVIFILGPTGVGKSKMAVFLAHQCNGEIISADSVQIYKGFNIGSAKVTEKEMDSIVHHGIDICQPNEYFSVFDFVAFTRKKIAEITARKKLPIVVGGTGLYIKALLEGYNFGGTVRVAEFRLQTQKRIELEGGQAIWNELHAIAPEIANKIDWHNKKRLIRGLEIARYGETQEKNPCTLDSLLFALTLPRDILYERINERVDCMMKSGLVSEVKSLLNAGVLPASQPMQAIGYKDTYAFLQGEISMERAVELIKQHSRNYAKRQLTFLRGMQQVQYVDVLNYDKAQNEILSKVEEWL